MAERYSFIFNRFYRTAINVNKSWNPNNYGFDINIGGCSYGQPASYFAPYKNGNISEKKKGEYLTDRLGDESVDYINNYNPSETGKPFFLYLSFYAVHTPYQVPQDEVKNNNGNKYHALIQKMDENVGKVLNALKDNKIEKNTVVIFYSDNGGVMNNPPYSGKKGSLNEGGIKVPLLVCWPEVTKPGSVCDQLVTSVDFYPTMYEITHNAKPTDVTSGKSIISLLKGEYSKDFDRAIYWHFPHNRKGIRNAMSSAIRENEWKMIYSYTNKKYMLYNLSEDIREINDVSEKYLEKVDYLKNKLNRWLNECKAEMPEYK